MLDVKLHRGKFQGVLKFPFLKESQRVSFVDANHNEALKMGQLIIYINFYAYFGLLTTISFNKLMMHNCMINSYPSY